MAYDDSLCPYYFPSIDSTDLQLQSIGVFNPDMSLGLDMDSAFSSDLSTGTGYLQDAIVAWNNRCKRRRISSYSHDQMADYSKNCWNLEDHEDPFEKFGSLVQNYNLIPERNPLQNWVNSIGKGWIGPVEKKPVGHEHHKNQLFSLSSSHMDYTETKDPHQEKDPSTIKGSCVAEDDSFVLKKVAYPFDMVKPGGIEGDVTLEDINERMLMRPTRPVRHPVGDLATQPIAMTGGLGLSGKAVVALTRIRTRGRGTVTIIRTRG